MHTFLGGWAYLPYALYLKAHYCVFFHNHSCYRLKEVCLEDEFHIPKCTILYDLINHIGLFKYMIILK
jgi:hypothetical protein